MSACRKGVVGCVLAFLGVVTDDAKTIAVDGKAVIAVDGKAVKSDDYHGGDACHA